MKAYFLKEEEEKVMKKINVSNYTFINKEYLNNIKDADILFVFNKELLFEFIDIAEEEHNIFETIDIPFIVVADIDLFYLILNNWESVGTTIKVEESYMMWNDNKKLFRFFRINNNKFYTIIKNFNNFYYVEDDKGVDISIDNKKVSKCYDYNLDGVNHYEKDINIMTRYSLELVKKNKVKFNKNFRICTFDIETYASVDSLNTPESIICIAANDSFTGETSYFEIRNKDINNERKMLEEFFKFVSRFDIFCGFNINKFDIPYLLNRAKLLGVDLSLLTNIKDCFPSCKYRPDDNINQWFSLIPGMHIVDLIGLAEKSIGYLDVKLPDKKLDTLGKYILGEQKTETDTPAILFDKKEFDMLKEYTIQDVNLACKLDNKLGLIEVLFSTIELVPGLNLDAAIWNSKIIDFYLLSKFNIILPTVNRNREKDIKGAIVFDTIPGIHDKVGIYDVSGMYPSLIRSLNISPDTKDNINGNIIIGQTKFISTKKGILVKLVEEFTELRKHYKIMKKEHEEDADYKLWQLKEFTIKKILASVYGVFGFIGFRLFDNDIANAITEAGRGLLLHMKKISEDNGYKVIMGDTDGIAISKKIGEPDFELLEKIINDSLFSWMKTYTEDESTIKKHKIIIECETEFLRVIFTTAKKKYMGLVIKSKGKLLDKPQFYGKGNELMRKDTPAGIKKELSKIVMTVLNNSDKNNNILIIKDKIKEIKSSLPSWGKDDLIIYKEINRNFDDYKVKPIHVRGALNSNKYLGTSFSRQDYKGGYIFAKSHKYPEADILFMNESTKLTDEFVIDYDKYFEKFIKQKILLIFGPAIYEEVFTKNRKLDEFWLLVGAKK